jgi:hypothetical protein
LIKLFAKGGGAQGSAREVGESKKDQAEEVKKARLSSFEVWGLP